MRWFSRAGESATIEPVHKLVAMETFVFGRAIRVYHSGGMIEGIDMDGDSLVVDGYSVTREDAERGWVDLDDVR